MCGAIQYTVMAWLSLVVLQATGHYIRTTKGAAG